MASTTESYNFHSLRRSPSQVSAALIWNCRSPRVSLSYGHRPPAPPPKQHLDWWKMFVCHRASSRAYRERRSRTFRGLSIHRLRVPSVAAVWGANYQEVTVDICNATEYSSCRRPSPGLVKMGWFQHGMISTWDVYAAFTWHSPVAWHIKTKASMSRPRV